MPPPHTTAVVPTLGRSALLGACVAALRADGGSALEIVVVDQAETALDLDPRHVDRLIRPSGERLLGFAAANNLAIEATTGDYVATVNDDAVVEVGWLASLTAALAADTSLGAVQGTNLKRHRSGEIDGCGIGWNRWWQAIQVDRGRTARGAGSRSIFGVSATAALYRREALDAAALRLADRPIWFDERLGSYYEDVDLAGRLRGAGWNALHQGGAHASHAGSITGDTLDDRGAALIYGNRWLVVARLLGRALWMRLPIMMLRDLLDLWQARRSGDENTARGIRAGWQRARGALGSFAHRGAPAVPLADLRGFPSTNP